MGAKRCVRCGAPGLRHFGATFRKGASRGSQIDAGGSERITEDRRIEVCPLWCAGPLGVISGPSAKALEDRATSSGMAR